MSFFLFLKRQLLLIITNISFQSYKSLSVFENKYLTINRKLRTGLTTLHFRDVHVENRQWCWMMHDIHSHIWRFTCKMEKKVCNIVSFHRITFDTVRASCNADFFLSTFFTKKELYLDIMFKLISCIGLSMPCLSQSSVVRSLCALPSGGVTTSGILQPTCTVYCNN